MSGLAKDARTMLAMLPDAEVNSLEIEKSDKAASGFVGVIQVKGGRWAGRLTQRGRQLHVPGLFQEPLQAAQMRAYFKRQDAVLPSPPKRAKRGSIDKRAKSPGVSDHASRVGATPCASSPPDLMQESQPCVVMAVPASPGAVVTPGTVCVCVSEL